MTSENVRVNYRISKKTDDKVRQLAELENRSISSVYIELVEKALNERKEVLGISLIDSVLNKVLTRHFKTLSDRLSRLLARTLIESLTTRSLTLQILAHDQGQETARAYNQKAYQTAIKNSKKRIEELEEILQGSVGEVSFEREQVEKA